MTIAYAKLIGFLSVGYFSIGLKVSDVTVTLTNTVLIMPLTIQFIQAQHLELKSRLFCTPSESSDTT